MNRHSHRCTDNGRVEDLRDRTKQLGGDLQLAGATGALHVVMARLPRRERQILSLRFYGNLSQSQIAEQVGLSQMHVSRLLRHSLEFLRRRMT